MSRTIMQYPFPTHWFETNEATVALLQLPAAAAQHDPGGRSADGKKCAQRWRTRVARSSRGGPRSAPVGLPK